MSTPEMSGKEAMQFLNGRTEATMFVCCLNVGAPMLKPIDLLNVFQGKYDSVASMSTSSPEDQAYLKGYASVLSCLKDTLNNVAIGAAMNLSGGPSTNH